jgi:hypothetical protein
MSDLSRHRDSRNVGECPNLDGTGVSLNFGANIGAITGTAVDSAAGKIYLASGSDIVQANLDGTGMTTVVSNLDNTVGGIAVDSVAGRIYWTQTADGLIESANLTNPKGVRLRVARDNNRDSGDPAHFISAKAYRRPAVRSPPVPSVADEQDAWRDDDRALYQSQDEAPYCRESPA